MSRSLRILVVWALALLCLLPVAPTFGQSSGAVTADKEGWWNAAADATAGTPLPPPPSTVPAGAIAVGAAGGQPDKVAAIGIVLDAERGSVVERFVLTLKEAEGPGAQQGEGAAIVACPVTAFFAPEENGALADAPEADCEAAQAEGTRADDGTWTFDLAPIADAWLDPFGTLNPNGIRLNPGGETPFQVSLTGMEDATFDVAISPPQEESDPFDSVTTTLAGGFGGSTSSGSSSGSSGSSGSGIAVTPAPTPDVAVGEGDTPVTTLAAGADEEAAAETDEPAPSRAGEVSGNLPFGVWLLLLGALGIALLAMWHLGPAGRVPHAKTQRSGGVSRALAARTPSTGASS